MTAFLTEADVAETLGVTVTKVQKWRRRYGWPFTKIGREIRFTESDMAAIARLHHVDSDRPEGLPGQTALSVARSR